MRFAQDSCALRRIALATFALTASAAWAQEVTLPLAEFEALRERAAPPDAVAPSSPTPIVLETSVVEIVVGQETARVTADMTLAIYEAGWQELALPPGGSLTSVELGGLEGRVSSSAPGSERVLFCRGVGRHTIRVGSVVAVTVDRAAARPTRSLEVVLPRAGTVTGTLRSVAVTDEVELVSGAIADGAVGSAVVRFIGEPGGRLRARVLGESDAASEREGEAPLAFDASSLAMTHVRRSRVELSGYLALDIIQGRMQQVRLPVPEGMDVLAVTSPAGVELGWDLDAEGALVVRFAEAVTGEVPVRLELARSFAVGEGLERFEAPLLVPDDASGTMLVSGLSADEDGIPILLRASSARRATEDDLELIPDSARSKHASLFVVREPERPPEWRVEWAESDPASVLGSQVDRLVVDALVGEAGRVAYQYWAVVRSPGASSLTVAPPRGFVLAAAERSGRRITAGRTETGIVLPLAAGSESQVVRLAGIVEAPPVPERGTYTIPVPALSAPVARVEVRAVVPGQRRYEIASVGFEGPIGTAPTGAWFAVPSSHRVVTASWSAVDARPSPLEMRVSLEREKRRWY